MIYGMFAFLSDVGGFAQSFMILGYLLVQSYAKHKYFAELLNRMYNVKKDEDASLKVG
jgi:hypothetical protein